MHLKVTEIWIQPGHFLHPSPEYTSPPSAPGELLVEEAEAINEGNLKEWETERQLNEMNCRQQCTKRLTCGIQLNTMAMILSLLSDLNFLLHFAFYSHGINFI